MEPRKLTASISEFLAWSAARRDPKTVALHKRYLWRFAGMQTVDDLASVTRLAIDRFSAKKHPVQSVKTFFAWCVNVAGFLEKNPAQAIPLPPTGNRTRTYDRREMLLARKYSHADLRAALVALQETGMRPGEARSVLWEEVHSLFSCPVDDVTLESGNCYILKTEFKGRTRRRDQSASRVVPISPRLGRLLWRIRRKLTCVSGAIFRNDAGDPWSRDALICRIKRLRARLAASAGIDPHGFVAYGYRHTFATRLAMDRVGGKVLADMMGHSTERLLSRYVHPSIASMCEILKKGSRPTKKPR